LIIQDYNLPIYTKKSKVMAVCGKHPLRSEIVKQLPPFISLDFKLTNCTEAVVFCLVAPCSFEAVEQRFGDRAASIFRVEVRGQGAVSTALLPTQRGS
jgi:hypothetical protein